MTVIKSHHAYCYSLFFGSRCIKWRRKECVWNESGETYIIESLQYIWFLHILVDLNKSEITSISQLIDENASIFSLTSSSFFVYTLFLIFAFSSIFPSLIICKLLPTREPENSCISYMNKYNSKYIKSLCAQISVCVVYAFVYVCLSCISF